MLKKYKTHLASLLAVGLLFQTGLASAQGTLARIQENGEFFAGVRPDGPPTGYQDSNGKFQGFGVDIAREIAKKLDVKVTFIASNSKTRIPLLTSSRFDAEFGSTTPTRKREEVVDFSIIYIWDTVVPLVRAGDSKNPADYGPPRIVSTTQGNYAITLFEGIVPDAEITTFPEYTDAVLALVGGKVDAVLTNRFIAEEFAKKYAGKLTVGDSFFTDPQAIMVRENDSEWRKMINWTVQELWADGTYQALFEKHYGYAPNFNLWSENGLQPGIE